jgi:hypothetical protein
VGPGGEGGADDGPAGVPVFPDRHAAETRSRLKREARPSPS